MPFYYFFILLLLDVIDNNDDPESEVALNLICVDDSTRKPIDIPIRPRPVKDLINEVRKFKTTHSVNDFAKIESELKNKSRLDRKNLTKSGMAFC